MPQITLDIPDNKLQFFMELIESLDFIHLEQIDDVPEEHKRIVLERIRKSEKIFRHEPGLLGLRRDGGAITSVLPSSCPASIAEI